MPATTKTYKIKSLISSIVLTIGENACQITKSGKTYDVDRNEAANTLRYVRAKGFASITK